jgi:serine/threonine-protein kinase
VTAKPTAAPNPARESAKDRRARETRDREARDSDARVAAAAKLVAPPTGTVKIAISPWGLVEVDGGAAGAAPPITELTLAEGRHQIVVRNGDYAPYTATVNVVAGQSISLRHKFGS